MGTGRQGDSDERPPAEVGRWGIAEIVAAKHCSQVQDQSHQGYRGHTWLEISQELSRANGENVTWQATRARYLHRDKALFPPGETPMACPICEARWAGTAAGLVQVAITGNYATADGRDGRIRTEADLRAACQLGEAEWSCFFFEAGTYEGFAKNEDKDLTFTAGVIDGHAKSKGLVIAPMFRTKGRFVRREPEALHPAVQPVDCPVTFARPPARPLVPGAVRRALHRLGIDWVGDYPDGESWLGGLRLQHGDKARAGPGATAAALAKEGDVDTAFGHVHKQELASRVVKTRSGKRTVRTWCPACVCHVDGRVPGASKNDHWQNGFGVVEYTDWSWSPTNVEIVDGRAIWDRGIVEGRDRAEELRADLPGWNW